MRWKVDEGAITSLLALGLNKSIEGEQDIRALQISPKLISRSKSCKIPVWFILYRVVMGVRLALWRILRPVMFVFGVFVSK